jgi:hypothetical protein
MSRLHQGTPILPPPTNKFFEAHGPVAYTGVCKHSKGSEVQKHLQLVSKHKQIWGPEPVPPGFWDSDFPTPEREEELRREADLLVAEKARLRAEEAAKGDGRWKRRQS